MILLSCRQQRRHLRESDGHDCDDAWVTGTHCAAPEVHRVAVCVLFAARARCKHIVCPHTAPHCSTLVTHSTLLHNHRPLSRASGDKSFRRDVFSREARRHRLMCILAATPLLQLFLFCNCSRATSAGTRFNYTSAAQVLRPTQILPALGIQIMETTHTRKHQSQKT